MKQSSQRRHGRLGDGLVLLPGAAADADSAHDLAVVPQRHTAPVKIMMCPPLEACIP